MSNPVSVASVIVRAEINLAAELADINANHAKSATASKQTLAHARLAGQRLRMLKKRLGHGRWGEVLRGLTFSERTARTYMRLAENWAALPEDENLSIRAADLLLAPETDSETAIQPLQPPQAGQIGSAADFPDKPSEAPTVLAQPPAPETIVPSADGPATLASKPARHVQASEPADLLAPARRAALRAADGAGMAPAEWVERVLLPTLR